jgi:hypothetical protein
MRAGSPRRVPLWPAGNSPPPAATYNWTGFYVGAHGSAAVATGQGLVPAQRVGFVQFFLHGRKSLQRARAHAALGPCLNDGTPAEPGIRNDRDRQSLLETAVVLHLLNDDPGQIDTGDALLCHAAHQAPRKAER